MVMRPPPPYARCMKDGAMTVREALDSKRINVVYQPVVDLETLDVFAYETLVRCKEFASPPALIGAAVAEGLIGELGRRIRELAVEQCPDHPLFLNIDPNEFDHGWLVRTDDPIFEHSHDVHLEITESVPLSHHRHCNGVLREIRGRGVRLAVDDLGAGYSNLRYIADLSPEVVKLDRELVRNLQEDKRLQTLVGAIVALCDRLGARVVAEGIETLDELEASTQAGVHFAQGYFLARPANPLPKVTFARA